MAKLNNSSDPTLSLGEWEDVHKWRKKGDCIECHSSNIKKTDLSDTARGLTIYATSYHTEEFKKFTHGHTQNVVTESCLSCHEKSTCVTCHTKMPPTHTTAFTNPGGAGEGMKLHILLGRIRPSSCLVCHNSFVESCTGCHTIGESNKWQVEGEKGLGEWGDIFNMKYSQ